MEEDNWNTVSVQNEEPEKIEIEFEEPQEEQKPEVEVQKEEVVKEEEEAPELEGIETNGATRRIKKLLFERQELEKHNQALIQKNEELNTNLRTKDKEVNTLGKTSLDASQKQLTDKIELAR